MKKAYIFILVSIFFQSCNFSPTGQEYKIKGEAQGTYYSIIYYHHHEITKFEIDSILDNFNLTASIFVENSIISKINRNEDVELNEDFVNIFEISQSVSRDSDGAFDISVGPLVEAWGFGTTKSDEIDMEKIASLGEIVGYEKLKIVDRKLIKEHPAMELNFNAIAKGYAVDLVGEYLENQGVENYLVDIGGEVLAKGKKNNGKMWVVGIERPSKNMDDQRELYSKIEISNQAIATSGTYRKYIVDDGVRKSHTIDPKTLMPISHNLLSATVIAQNACLADAYATAFMVMGLEKSVEFIEQNPDKKISAYFIYEDKTGTLKDFATDDLANKLVEIN